MKELWNNRYQEKDIFGTEANSFLQEHVEALPEKGKILCLAEGEGRNAIFLAQKGFDVTAVDFSQVGLKHAEERAQEEGVFLTTIVADLKDYSFGENKWDAIISIFGHLPPEIRQVVHKKIPRALKNQGIFLFEAYSPEQLQFKTGGPMDLELMITLGIVQEELSELKTLYLKNLVREIYEGKYHSGLSSVIQYIGQKRA